MANHAISDQQDWMTWKAIHDDWAKLFISEAEYRRGRAPAEYVDLIESLKSIDASSSETRGSSASQLSSTHAFERGYAGGWR